MSRVLSSPVSAAAPPLGLGFRPRIATRLSRPLSIASSAGRFLLHFGEMCLAMQLGMLAFMPAAGLIPASLQQVAMGLAMTAPMVAWMRLRGHAWRHGLEMAAGMLLPWAAVLGLAALGAAKALPWLAQADGPAMYLGMLAVMLARPGHYTHGAGHAHAASGAGRRRALRIPWRRVFLATAYVAAIVLVPLLVATANFGHKIIGAGESIQAVPYAGTLPAPPAPDPTRKIAVVLSGPRGSEIGDTLEAYEILARSGAFTVYSVAPERTALPLLPGAALVGSGLDFVPHFSFAEYEAQIGRPPDLIAIPYFDGGYSPERDAASLDWIRGHFGPRTTILAICAGTAVLADTGLLDGRTATTNTGWFGYAESHAPTTTWLRNVRYVDDGNVVTSSNLTAGIDATLHVVDRFAGRATALDVARQIGYTHTGALDDPRFDPPGNPQLSSALMAGLEGPQQRLGMLLYDGVTELGVAGLVDPYLGSLTARTVAMAPERRIVLSRDGFLFLPRYDFRTVPALDRVLVPVGEADEAKRQTVEAWGVARPTIPAKDIYQDVGRGETAYDASIEDLARARGASLARVAADGLFYASDKPLPGVAWPISEALAALALSLLGAAAVFGVTHLKVSRPRRPRPALQPA